MATKQKERKELLNNISELIQEVQTNRPCQCGSGYPWQLCCEGLDLQNLAR